MPFNVFSLLVGKVIQPAKTVLKAIILGTLSNVAMVYLSCCTAGGTEWLQNATQSPLIECFLLMCT